MGLLETPPLWHLTVSKEKQLLQIAKLQREVTEYQQNMEQGEQMQEQLIMQLQVPV